MQLAKVHQWLEESPNYLEVSLSKCSKWPLLYKETHQGPQHWEQNWCWDENRIEWKLLIGQIIHRVQLPVLCAHLDATQSAKERAEMIHIEKLIKCKRIWQNKFLIWGSVFAMCTETKAKRLSFTLLAKYLE